MPEKVVAHAITFFRNFENPVEVTFELVDAAGSEIVPREKVTLVGHRTPLF